LLKIKAIYNKISKIIYSHAEEGLTREYNKNSSKGVRNGQVTFAGELPQKSKKGDEKKSI
jgi:hypothetical protein